MDKVFIFDTTLRDGEQSAGVTLNSVEKMEIAKQLEKLGVDIIEAGFPATSPGDFEAVSRIAKEIRTPIICGLARAVPNDVDRACEAIKGAANPRVHVFISSSDIHLVYQYKKSRDEILEMGRAMVARAKKQYSDVEFSPMDASRTDTDFLYKIVEAAIDAGATTVNIPDTVGYAMTAEWGDVIEGILNHVPNIHKAVISVHCHNDLGNAVANSLEAVRRGARQIECTINGIGERAGNASLEEVVMGLKTRQEYFKLTTGVDTTQIYRSSRLVSELTGFAVQPNKAIVGGNAFRHESGIHQDGVIKMPITYEIIDPKSIGLPSSTLVLGKLSGRHAFGQRLEELGFKLNAEELGRAFAAFKDLADKKKEITDRDLESLMAEDKRIASVAEFFHLEQVQVSCGDKNIPTASVRLTDAAGKECADAALGTGPIDAVYKAINRIVGVPNTLTEFTVKSVTQGIDAIGEVLIRIESDGVGYTGRGADTDIIVASAKAYMNALNRLLSDKGAVQAKAL